MINLEALLNLKHEAESSHKLILNNIDKFHCDLQSALAGGLLFESNIETEKMFNVSTVNFGFHEFLNRYPSSTNDGTFSFQNRRIVREIDRLSKSYKIVIHQKSDHYTVDCSYSDDLATIDVNLKVENSIGTNKVSSIQFFAYEDMLRTIPVYEHSLTTAHSNLQLNLDLNKFSNLFGKTFYAKDSVLSSEFDFVNMQLFEAFVSDAMLHPDKLDRFGAVFGSSGIQISTDTFIESAINIAASHRLESLSGLDYLKRLAKLTEYNSFYLGHSKSKLIAEALIYYLHDFSPTQKVVELYAAAEHLNLFTHALFDPFKRKNANLIDEMKSCFELGELIDSSQRVSDSTIDIVVKHDITHSNNSL
ncbi:hypothetical protein GCM10011607_12440 [Shewanella inventionis]|uniref:Uncharacterized protein n=2 Tax=Shewanella inventionis TaxID=1738770 RepID=A0ABQ1IVX8_9GAMM|nr:hypothetical protein GCM10011607_12440 [Shewanella inventionis]